MHRNRRSSKHTLALFAALSKRPQAWQYGYQLSQLTGLKSGTLYPILMRLCDRGLLEAKWQPSPQSGRPPRHMYRLTGSGALFARSEHRRSSEERAQDVPAGRYA
jgi:PadR family transcriptional regulator, regulatory protein PadR